MSISIFNIDLIRRHYDSLPERMFAVRQRIGRPLTLTEKIFYAHLRRLEALDAVAGGLQRGVHYAHFTPDRVAMQDATAQMAVLQFMNAGRDVTAVPSTIHCDHLILAHQGVERDLPAAQEVNREVYDFLSTAAHRYGMDFWPAGAGIIHQVVLENYAFPGGMMVGTDSHTPNAGGLGMAAIGVGGADAVDVMTDQPWELRMPKVIGVRLSGILSQWASPKDVILHLTGLLTVKGATNAVVEYFGPGAETLSCTGKATICNMGAEIGATCSLFPFDKKMADYLRATGREEVAQRAEQCTEHLVPDFEVTKRPEEFYDQFIDLDLSTLQPHINGPFTPDAATPISQMAKRVQVESYPDQVDVVLIGSCTNSSYEDLKRAASVAERALEAGYMPKTQIIINPGSEQIRATAERDGLLDVFAQCGAVLMTNACGPCIGQWKRITDDNQRPNSIITTFNRNFAKRADGNPHTHAFITSPELAMGFAFTGKLSCPPSDFFNFAPQGEELPAHGFTGRQLPEIAPSSIAERKSVEVIILPDSERLQRLKPFPAPLLDTDFHAIPLLIKTKGKCTTDHISMAGPWLKYRGHLENISRNLLMGAVNAFSGAMNAVRHRDTGDIDAVSAVAKAYHVQYHGSWVAAEENYGEGSSREHAAMEPRFLGVKWVVAKSFARIHETNLKKQGILALTFANPADYDRILEDDRASIIGLDRFSEGKSLTLRLIHQDGGTEDITVLHSYNQQQIEWFQAGAALNVRH